MVIRDALPGNLSDIDDDMKSFLPLFVSAQLIRPELHALVWIMGIASLIILLLTFITVPLVIIQLPGNYLCQDYKSNLKSRLGYWYWLVFPLKNLLGVVCLILGCVMLVTPGQGLLTILTGLLLVNFPGKHNLICRLMLRPALFKSVNWIRKKAGQEPLNKPTD